MEQEDSPSTEYKKNYLKTQNEALKFKQVINETTPVRSLVHQLVLEYF